MKDNTNLVQIRAQLLAGGCPDYSLTKPLTKLAAVGYAPLDWHERKVSMVCLKDTKNKPVMLFVMDTASLQNTPQNGETEFAKIHRFNSVSRAMDGKIYIVAGPQDISELKAYLD